MSRFVNIGYANGSTTFVHASIHTADNLDEFLDFTVNVKDSTGFRVVCPEKDLYHSIMNDINIHYLNSEYGKLSYVEEDDSLQCIHDQEELHKILTTLPPEESIFILTKEDRFRLTKSSRKK